ncbi:unnamed protein product, partial [Discosporangium mesarthrocarpum]
LFPLPPCPTSLKVGLKAFELGSLFRQAPWLVNQHIDGQMLPVVRYLRGLGVYNMERVVRAYPRVLCASVEKDLAPRVDFLYTEVGVSEDDLPRMLETFPLLLALSMGRMKASLRFMTWELNINSWDAAKIVRQVVGGMVRLAFPSLLGLEVERHMRCVVTYLEQLGVQNVGRFVSRLPPVLGYDVETNLRPKMDYLVASMGLSVYDILTFPAYFSYPLETVTEPRTCFLNLRRRPITLVGLNTALQSGDDDFARKVAKVRPELYRDFK